MDKNVNVNECVPCVTGVRLMTGHKSEQRLGSSMSNSWNMSHKSLRQGDMLCLLCGEISLLSF